MFYLVTPRSRGSERTRDGERKLSALVGGFSEWQSQVGGSEDTMWHSIKHKGGKNPPPPSHKHTHNVGRDVHSG